MGKKLVVFLSLTLSAFSFADVISEAEAIQKKLTEDKNITVTGACILLEQYESLIAPRVSRSLLNYFQESAAKYNKTGEGLESLVWFMSKTVYPSLHPMKLNQVDRTGLQMRDRTSDWDFRSDYWKPYPSYQGYWDVP